jgi:hypothetical protein
MIQFIVDRFLDRITLHDLVKKEEDSTNVFVKLLLENEKEAPPAEFF